MSPASIGGGFHLIFSEARVVEQDVNIIRKQKNKAYALMCMLVVLWGLDYVIAKTALELLEPLSLLFFKYACGFTLVFIIKMKVDRSTWVRKKDIPLFIACSIFGEILYFYCEYSAIAYLPLSIISIIISFVPAVSVIIERVLYKKKANKKIILGIAASIFGVALIIGVDFSLIFQGKGMGYLLAFACVFFWNAYNFITVKLHNGYSTVSLTLNQLTCTLLLLSPYMIHGASGLPNFTPVLAAQVIYLGVMSAGIGFLIVVRSLHVIGETATALFSNFMPITVTFFGWLILQETISPIQMAGGIIVIIAGYIVIKEKGNMEELTDE
jgi:drug/metabolite transporter (DMT)-like permease